jgi:hypothetical protein
MIRAISESHEVEWAAYRFAMRLGNLNHWEALELTGAVVKRARLDIYASRHGMLDAVWQYVQRFLPRGCAFRVPAGKL